MTKSIETTWLVRIFMNARTGPALLAVFRYGRVAFGLVLRHIRMRNEGPVGFNEAVMLENALPGIRRHPGKTRPFRPSPLPRLPAHRKVRLE